MSAGTRSSAITATAPASSAILAWSGVTTSMITPPLSISAMPRFTRAVPVAGALAFSALTVDTRTSLDQSRLLTTMVWPAGGEIAPAPAWSAGSGTEGDAGLLGDEGVVHLEEHRGFGPAGQVQHAGQRPAPRVPGHRDQVVVELAGHEHLVRGLLNLGQQLVGAFLAAQRGTEVGLAEGGPQRPGQVALGQVTRPFPAPRPEHRRGQQEAGGRIEQPGGSQFLGHGTAPQQGHVQRDAGYVHPRVQPVDPSGPPGHVDPDEQRARDNQDDVGDHGKAPVSWATATGVRPSMTVS